MRPDPTSKKRILVIGGMNMDILGTPKGQFQLRDSVMGHVLMTPGGVGRNIAAQLSNMGARVSFLTVLGNDQNAETLAVSCRQMGIDLSLSLHADCPSPVYLAIHDRTGDMVSAVNDMRAMEMLSAVWIKETMMNQIGFDACVVDANLSEDCLTAVADIQSAPIVADPVSAAKSGRLKPIFKKLRAIKPNLLEAQALTGCEKPEDAAKSLLLSGVRQVFISLGMNGVYYDDGMTSGFLKPSIISRAGATGAGDAMTAGIAFAIASGMNTRAAALMGLKASGQTLKNHDSEPETNSSREDTF